MVLGPRRDVLPHPWIVLLLQQQIRHAMGEFNSREEKTLSSGAELTGGVPSTQYLIFGGFITGIGTGCWYVAESGTIMSLAPSGARGKYLALWIVARNLGQLVGGAIK